MTISCKQYIDILIKKIEDVLNNNGYEVDLLDEDLSVDEPIYYTAELESTEEQIKTKDLLSDSNNRFVTDLEKEEFTNKIGKIELEQAISNIRSDINKIININIDNMLNSKDIMNGIANLLSLLQNNPDAKDLIDQLSNMVNNNDLINHIKSNSHLTDDDRVALNQLLKFISIGCADWNASEGEPNYIRNKPEALPANGGDANTVGGYCAGKLINKQLDYRIFGIDGNDTYGKNEVNIMFRKEYTAKKLNGLLKPNVSISMREGIYECEVLNFPEGLCIHGTHSSIIEKTNINAINNCELEEMYIKDSELSIDGENVSIDNCIFKNCNISLNVNLFNLKNCKFINCTIYCNKVINSIIKDNMLQSSSGLTYLGGNNIITDNVYI